ncbi:MAG: hypothetical protein Q8N99_01235 [Nanoarchaeota archaeon]|nr:hypothetical protein [Nanoarchaeota archaeon]
MEKSITNNRKIKCIFIYLLILFNINLIMSQTFGGYDPYSTSSATNTASFSGNTVGATTNIYGSSVNPQFTNPSYGGGYEYTSTSAFWPQFNQQDCMERQDVILQIVPGGCSPAVVRSDLLEEQNVPIFCKVMSVHVNPLVDLTRVRSIHFSGQYPKGVSGVSYYPPRIAIRNSEYYKSSWTRNPINPDMGYLVIVLAKNPVEKDMPESIEGNITATIDYDSEGAFGIGETNFYLNEMNDPDWLANYKNQGFWNGKAYIRADAIEPNAATISLYRDFDSRQATVTLRPGETSKDIYLNGFYCAAGMNIRLEKIAAPVESALLQIDGQQVWVSKGDRIIDNKCRVLDLQTYSGGGKLILSCPGSNGRMELSLNAGKASFNLGQGNIMNFAIGDKIFPDKNIYVAYMDQDINNKKYTVLIRDDFSMTKYEYLDKQVFEAIDKVVKENRKSYQDLEPLIKKAVENQYKLKIKKEIQKDISNNVEIKIVIEGSSAFGVILEDTFIAKDKDYIYEQMSAQEILSKEYYDKSIQNYEDLADFYPAERRIADEDTYAAVGLYEAARLSKLFGMDGKAKSLYDRLVRDYPDSNMANRIISERNFLMKYDTSKSKSSFVMNNEAYSIELLDIKKPTRNQLSAVFLVDGKEETLGIDDIRAIKNNDFIQTIQLKSVEDDFAYIKYDKTLLNSTGVTRNEKLGLYENSQTMLDGINIKLLKINLDKQAKVVIIPKTFGQRAKSDFKFKIGIEKRAIQLSPEQTKELMINLLNSMKQWNDLNRNLGNAIKAMKGACFATSAILTFKNLLAGADGESMARDRIMIATGGWNDICERLVNEKKYSTVQQCLLNKGSEIQNDVKIYSDNIKQTNNIIKDIEKEVGIKPTDILDFQGQVNTQEVEKKFKERFDEFCKGASGSVTLPGVGNSSIPFSGENGICSMQGLTHEQRRDIMTLYGVKEAGGSEALKKVVDSELGNTVLSAKNYDEMNKANIESEKNTNLYNLGIKPINPTGDFVIGEVKRITKVDSSHNIYKNFRQGAAVVRVFIPEKKSFGNTKFTADPSVANKEVIVEMNEISGIKGSYTPLSNGSVFTIDGQQVTGKGLESVRNYMSLSGLDRVKEGNNKAYQNAMKNPEKLMVKYFDRAPYKGLPAEVPFDINEGWYAEMTYVLTGFGKPYDESGRVINFYICNVGENGIIEFKKSADDICRYYNVETGADINFPGMNSAEARNIVIKAQQAVYDAAKQYGKDRITINGKIFKSGTSFGGQEGRCTDFMSPQDCNILFNVCDPVICPASRCDLGGQFRVDNVIQTGVIGSLMLCLPNVREGIAVPICLTGVHAGIEGYVSILNSAVQCLNESLETGRNVGICDEIKSIYLCEFFWKQAIPFLNVLLPRMIESMYNQGARGGGEYTTVQNAWDNMQNAIGYFRNEYAVNSMHAFAGRSTDDIGVEFCKSFISLSMVNSGEIFKRLIEPDSPSQYHAWFSEDVLTTATVPPTSHYKVYYHIYSGKDFGSYFAVYLKDVPSNNMVFTTGSYVVARGYIPRGGRVDEARDFSAPSGFKQLCISINGKDECGFGQVTTSYMLNSMTDSFVQEQLKTGINSEKECVAGTPSLSFSPNLQSMAENALEPQLYNQGIIRVCSSENPGKKVLPSGEYDKTSTSYDRWKNVGYCDDSTIRCWLDTNSAKNVIKNKGIEKQVLDAVDLANLGENNFYTDDMSVSIANQAEKDIDSLVINQLDTKASVESKIISIANSLDRLNKLANNNVHRARALYLLSNLYRKVAENLLPRNITGNTLVENVPVIFDASSASSGYSGNVEPGDIQIEYLPAGSSVNFIKVYENSNINRYDIINFDYNNQIVTLVSGEKKKVSKDIEGRIIFSNNQNIDLPPASSLAPGAIPSSKDENTNSNTATDANTVKYPDFKLELEDGTVEANLFYKYDFDEKKWYWSFYNNPDKEKSKWYPVPDSADSGMSSKNQAFLKSLVNKDCDHGLKLIVARVIANSEGGWFSNVGLVLYIDDDSKNIEEEDLSKISCSNIKKIS